MTAIQRVTAFMIALAGAVFTTGARTASLSPECKLVTDAARKQLVTPSHAYSTISGLPGHAAARTSEAIYAGGASYLRYKGEWRRSPLTIRKALQMKDENIRDATSMVCSYLRDESVSGESAAVYSIDTRNADIRAIGQIWISRSSGLPLKVEQDLDVDSPDKYHTSTRYEYGNVQAPAGPP